MSNTLEVPRVYPTPERVGLENGAALAAFMAAAIGSFAMGLIMILSEAGLLSIPALYEPAGGVTGRTTLAVVVWLVAWGVLHRRWRGRHLQVGKQAGIIALLIGLGILGTFPPVWSVF